MLFFFTVNLKSFNIETSLLYDLKPGQKLCAMCLKNVKAKITKSQTPAEDSSTSEYSSEEYLQSEPEVTNSILQACRLTPLKSVSRRDNRAYKRRKIGKIMNVVKKSLNFQEEENVVEKRGECQKCKDLDEIIEILKNKIEKEPCTRRKIDILSVLPKKWGVLKIMDMFDVSMYIAQNCTV